MKNFIFLFLSTLFFITQISAEKKTFKNNLSYQKTQFDTAETAKTITHFMLTDILENDLVKYIEKRNEIRALSFSAIELKAFVKSFHDIIIISEKTTTSTHSLTASMTIDTDMFFQYLLKTKNYPNTVSFYIEHTKLYNEQYKKLETLIKANSSLKNADTATIENYKKDFTQLINSVQSNLLTMTITANYLKQNFSDLSSIFSINQTDIQNNDTIIFFKGVTYAVMKKFDLAETLALTFQNASPQSPEKMLYASLIRAKVEAEKSNFSDALTYYAEALSHRPDYTETLFERAQLLFTLKKNQDALKDIEIFLKRNPMSSDGLFLQGNILFLEKKEKEALNIITKAAKLGHTQSIVWVKRYNANKTLQTEKQAERE